MSALANSCLVGRQDSIVRRSVDAIHTRGTFSTIKDWRRDAEGPRFESGNNSENWTNFCADVWLRPSRMNGRDGAFSQPPTRSMSTPYDKHFKTSKSKGTGLAVHNRAGSFSLPMYCKLSRQSYTAVQKFVTCPSNPCLRKADGIRSLERLVIGRNFLRSKKNPEVQVSRHCKGQVRFKYIV
jgi:hypothetical protein